MFATTVENITCKNQIRIMYCNLLNRQHKMGLRSKYCDILPDGRCTAKVKNVQINILY